jgi:hypothetical protein
MDALLKINGSHRGCHTIVGYEFSVILPNAENEAWSQHKYLHDLEYLIETNVSPRF